MQRQQTLNARPGLQRGRSQDCKIYQNIDLTVDAKDHDNLIFVKAMTGDLLLVHRASVCVASVPLQSEYGYTITPCPTSTSPSTSPARACSRYRCIARKPNVLVEMVSTPHAHTAEMQTAASSNGRPPPLPPRNSSFGDAPPPYTEPSIMALSSKDPRSSSTQSLVPDPSVDSTGQRRLLLVYIHGFMGDETSFRSFPAHVHNLVTITLADSHVVHTKLYPRYLSKHSLEIARDHFSEWCV